MRHRLREAHVHQLDGHRGVLPKLKAEGRRCRLGWMGGLKTPLRWHWARIRLWFWLRRRDRLRHHLRLRLRLELGLG